jgi:trehalose monomycolate/heme transporter
MPPSAGETRAFPVSQPVSKPVATDPESKGDPADPTTAIPVMRPDADDSDAATKKLNALGTSDSKGDSGDATRPHRRGASGGLSAQDLLRREGRL